jgi:uncharacterized membrane protein YccC
MRHVDLNSTKSHIRHGIKTGLASVLAYIAAEMCQLPFGYWAALSAVIVMQMSVADSIRMCWYRFSGTAVGALIAAIAILICPDNQPMTLLVLFLSIAFCAYMTRYNARYRMAAITTSIVFLASMGQPDRLIFGMERVLEIALGVTCAFIVSVTLWPQRASTALTLRLQNQFATMAGLYGELIDAFLHRQSMLVPDLLDKLEADVVANRSLYQGVLHHERLLYRDDTHALGLQLGTLETCLPHLRAMLNSLNDPQEQGYDILMEVELRALTKAIQQALTAIGQGDTPEEEPLAQALNIAHARLSDLRGQGVTKRFSLQMLMKFFSFYHSQRFMARVLLRHAEQKRATATGAPKAS